MSKEDWVVRTKKTELTEEELSKSRELSDDVQKLVDEITFHFNEAAKYFEKGCKSLLALGKSLKKAKMLCGNDRGKFNYIIRKAGITPHYVNQYIAIYERFNSYGEIPFKLTQPSILNRILDLDEHYFKKSVSLLTQKYEDTKDLITPKDIRLITEDLLPSKETQSVVEEVSIPAKEIEGVVEDTQPSKESETVSTPLVKTDPIQTRIPLPHKLSKEERGALAMKIKYDLRKLSYWELKEIIEAAQKEASRKAREAPFES